MQRIARIEDVNHHANALCLDYPSLIAIEETENAAVP